MQKLYGKPIYQATRFCDIRDIFEKAADHFSDIPAFMFREHPADKIQCKTFSELYEDMNAVGTSLIHMGFADQKIAVIGENSYRWAVAHLSTMSGMGISVPLDRLLPSEEILQLLERSQVSAVFFDASFLETMKKAKRSLPQIKAFICLRESPTNPTADVFSSSSDFFRFDDILEKGRDLLKAGDKRYRERKINSTAMVELLFTSGTTSQSKGVMLSSDNLVSDVFAMAQVESFPVGTRYLSVLPMHHTFESTCGLLFALSIGVCCCIGDGLRYIQKNFQEYKINLLIGVPLLFESFYKKIQKGLEEKGKRETVNRLIRLSRVLRKFKIDIRRIVFRDVLSFFGGEFRFGICGAAPIDPEIILFLEGIGIDIYQGYGLTETSPVIAACNPKHLVPGTVGLPVGDVTLAIDTDTAFEEGEILVKGPMVMMGYFEAEAATAEVMDEKGWFHTGDIGRIHKKTGCLSITGRMKSMIVLKNGKKIFPEEVEQWIISLPYVKEALVFGDIQPDGDVVVSTKIVFDKEILEQDHISEKELPDRLLALIREVNAKLPAYKAIRQFVYGFEPLCKTTTLKIRRSVEEKNLFAFVKQTGKSLKSMNGKNIDNLILQDLK